MASSRRTGRPVSAIGAILVGAILLGGTLAVAVIGGVDLLRIGDQFVAGLFPPEAVTDRGEHIRELYAIVFLIAAVIFFVVEGLIIWTVLRYRRRPGDDSLPAQTHGNAIAEIVWTVVPTLIVAFLFVVSWQTLNVVDAVSAEPQTKIRAVAGQFQWQFEYLPADYDPASPTPAEPVFTQVVPTGEDGGLVVPAGRTVQLYLFSPDVIHAFYVPQFLFKRDVVPGRLNSFEFTVNEEDAGGTFRGQCAELCGAGHRRDAVRRPRAHRQPIRRVARGEDRRGQRDAGRRPPPAQAAGPTAEAQWPSTSRSSRTPLTAPADTPFRIEFDNKDAAVPHNVAIHEGSPTGPEVFKGEVFTGPADAHL